MLNENLQLLVDSVIEREYIAYKEVEKSRSGTTYVYKI